MTQTDEVVTVQYDDDYSNLFSKCWNDYNICCSKCPCPEDEATTKVIANFDNENEGTFQHTTD
jgi:hypothetical protein